MVLLNANGNLVRAHICHSIPEALKSVKEFETRKCAVKQGRKFKVFYMAYIGFAFKIHTITASVVV